MKRSGDSVAEYFLIAADGVRVGPCLEAEVLELLANGEISRDTRCEDQSGNECSVGDLFDFLAPAPLSARQSNATVQPVTKWKPAPIPDVTPAVSERVRVVFSAHPAITNYWRAGACAFIAGAGGWRMGDFWAPMKAMGPLIALFILLWVVLHRMSTHYIITTRRIEVLRGLFAKSSREIRLSHVKAIHVDHRGLAGLFGVGTLTFSADGGFSEDVVFHEVADATGVKSLVRRLQDRGRNQ